MQWRPHLKLIRLVHLEHKPGQKKQRTLSLENPTIDMGP